MLKFIKKHSLLLFSLLTALVVAGICSKNSPLYPMNDWVDVHCFFTIGRALLDGQVLYTDLYEQKGPVLYFIYALVSLFSGSSFWGVFALEAASLTFFLYCVGKIVGLYTKVRLVPYLSIVAVAVIVGTSVALAHGGSVEEMCLGLMAYGLYTLLACFKEKRALTTKECIVNGVFAGMILWIKFTMLGFYMGLCVTVVIWYIVLKDWKNLLNTVGWFLAGVGMVTAVVLVYFIATGALKDLYTAYFYNNLFLYPSESEVSKLQQVKDCVKWALFYNKAFKVLLIIGGVWLAGFAWKRPMALVLNVLCFAGLATLTYWGGKGVMQGYGYYDLVLVVFTVFGFCAIGEVLDHIPWPQLKWTQILFPAVLAAALIVSGVFCFRNGRNVYLMSYEKEDMPQYQFAEIINTVEDPTLLNYGFLDGGFYYAAGVHPSCRFFCSFNVAAPDMWESQWDAMWAGELDFVVTRSYELPATFSKYEKVATANMIFEGIDFTYYLYALK